MKTFLRALALSALLVSAGALAEQPYDTIDQAQKAYDAAQAAGALQFSPDEMSLARARLQKARDWHKRTNDSVILARTALVTAEYANAVADKANAEAELAQWQKKMDELN
ncbi:MAG: DUF4398 domain-containing protein [Gammaproteobacteria bacterium]|nr:MAG: DUF4398 domain-containing protein [Gammaproteobacteria bacterium]